MSRIVKHIRLLARDARDVVSSLRRRDWIFGGLSVMMTAIVMWGFLNEHRWGYMKPDPIIAYFKSWQDGRSRADALAEQEEERLMAEADAVAESLDIGDDIIIAPEPELPPDE